MSESTSTAGENSVEPLRTLTKVRTATLHTDVQSGLEGLPKWEQMTLDDRNSVEDSPDDLEAFLQPGRSYRFTLLVEELPAE